MDNFYMPFVDIALYRQTYKGWKISTRKISDQELVLITSGVGKVKINDKTISVKQNDLIYFKPGINHSLWVESEPYMAFYAVHFSFSETNRFLPLPYLSALKNTIKLQKLFEGLKTCYLNPKFLHEWNMSISLQNLIYEILNEMHNQSSPANVKRVQKLLHIIHNNPLEKYTLEGLCKISKLKKSQLVKVFKEITGVTPIKYINNYRLESSKVLLISTDMKIKEVALSSGFSDELYYSRQFKKHFGTSPSQFKLN
ncbi:MAG: AraC family transcriptional regulator [Firmicutes bacterium]|nr:AraC family transcriptional regulator [Bacillota bacterium]